MSLENKQNRILQLKATVASAYGNYKQALQQWYEIAVDIGVEYGNHNSLADFICECIDKKYLSRVVLGQVLKKTNDNLVFVAKEKKIVQAVGYSKDDTVKVDLFTIKNEVEKKDYTLESFDLSLSALFAKIKKNNLDIVQVKQKINKLLVDLGQRLRNSPLGLAWVGYWSSVGFGALLVVVSFFVSTDT